MPSKNIQNYEERVELAAECYTSEKGHSFRQLATKYEVHRNTIWRRVNDIPGKTAQIPTNRALNALQEDTLLYWIQWLDNHGFSPSKAMIYAYANEIRRRDLPDAPDLSVKWTARFLKRQRHSGLTRIKIKQIEAARREAEDPVRIRKWFQKLGLCIGGNGIDPMDILNFDETGYRIGIGGDDTVLTYHPDRPGTLPSDTNREHVTVSECISAGGYVLPPVVIIKGKVLLRSYFEGLPDNWLLTTSDTGYINDAISLAVIKHIDKHSVQRQIGSKRLLLLDNHECHLSVAFLEYAEEHNIILFALPPHTTHFLQPLDVGCFQPNKHYHRKAVNLAVRMGNQYYSKLDFLHDLQEIRQQTFKETTIKSSFKRCGIWPFEPDVILDQLKPVEAPYQSPPPRHSTPTVNDPNTAVFTTWPEHLRPRDPIEDFGPQIVATGIIRSPRNAREFMALGETLTNELIRSSPEAGLIEVSMTIRKLTETSAKLVARGQVAEHDLRQTEAYTKARKQRKRQGRQRVPGGGILYADDARRAIAIADEHKEMMDEETQQRRTTKQARKQAKLDAKAEKTRLVQARIAVNKAVREQKAQEVAERKAERKRKRDEVEATKAKKRAKKDWDSEEISEYSDDVISLSD